MKKIIHLLLLIPCIGFSQVAIGKSEVSNPSVSLEFGTQEKGIVLPYVENKSAITEPGTIIFDTTDNRIKVKKSGTEWIDFSGRDGSGDISIQTGKTEKTQAKAIIGAATSTADGILVLESSNKAMVLPKVTNPETKIVNPAPGMLVYDPVKKLLCVYNGSDWTYWKN